MFWGQRNSEVQHRTGNVLTGGTSGAVGAHHLLGLGHDSAGGTFRARAGLAVR